MAEIEYIGGELELFAEATNWKRYFTSFFGPYIHGDVLEVGVILKNIKEIQYS